MKTEIKIGLTAAELVDFAKSKLFAFGIDVKEATSSDVQLIFENELLNGERQALNFKGGDIVCIIEFGKLIA